MTTATTDLISIACPNGCNRTVAAHGKDIHYCVIREFGETHREYIGCYDGEIITRAHNNSDCEIGLDDYVLRLVEDGLIDQPLAALDQAAALDTFQAEMLAALADPGDDPIDDRPRPQPQPEEDRACRNCGGAHHIQTCPEIWQAMRAASWTDGDNPEWHDGCPLMMARMVAVATALIACLLWGLR